jgi:hypothetical protein
MGNSLRRKPLGNSLVVNTVGLVKRYGNSLMASGAVAWLIRHVF